MKRVFTLYVLIFSLTSCQDKIEVFTGCCEKPAIFEKFGSGTIFIPNVITPNGDQINDRFIINGDSLRRITYIKIRNETGIIVYEYKDIPFNDLTYSWDGKINNRVERGIYSYEIHAESINYYLKIFKGDVCVCPCDKETDEDIIPIKNCVFGSDYTPDGISESHGEPLHCFEN